MKYLLNKLFTMSDQIKQIQATYLPIEDRILLKIHTENLQSIHAWITRRYLKLLLPLLQGQHPETGESFLKEDFPSQSNDSGSFETDSFSQPYAPPESPDFPLGESPVLLAKITFKEEKEQLPSLVLEPEEGSGIVITFHPKMVKALTGILHQAEQHAEWSMEYTYYDHNPVTVTLQ